MEVKEMIKVMEHYAAGGDIEYKLKNNDRGKWTLNTDPSWNWDAYDYRIKEQKQKVTIEKWLCQDKQGDYLIRETSNIDGYLTIKKIKLIESYEVEL